MLNLKRLPFFFVSLLFAVSSYAQWTQTSGPEGGSTSKIFELGTELLMHSAQGIVRSSDNGATWTLSNSGLPELVRVLSLTSDGSNVYVSVDQNGVYRSIDKGSTWFPANKQIEGLTFNILFAHGADLYAGSSSFGTVHHSPDNGNTWSVRSNGISGDRITGFTSFNSKIYASSRAGLFENDNQGGSWTTIPIPGLSPNGIRSMTADNGVFYVASDGQMFTATDDLSSWSLTPLANGGSITGMSHHNGTVYANTPRGYYYTVDNGASWVSVQNINTGHFINHVHEFSGKLILTSSGGNFESFDNGASWAFNTGGLKGQSISALSHNNSYLYAGTSGNGIFRSDDNGDSWTESNAGLDPLNSDIIKGVIALNDRVVIATDEGIFVSIDGGDNWVKKLDVGPNRSPRTLAYSNGLFATSVAGTGVYLSSDMGETWALTGTMGLNTQTDLFSLLIEDQKIVVGTASGEIFTSSDLGQNWTEITIPGDYFNYNDFVFKNDTLYAATHRDLWLSIDFGQNWQPFLASNPNPVQDIKKIIVEDDIVYAATVNGIQVSKVGRGSWYPVNEGMGPSYTTSIWIKDGLLFSGPSSRSVWSRPLSEIKVPILDDDNDGVANENDLCPNTPAGTAVTNLGCDVIAPNAISVYGTSPTCPDAQNGNIEIASLLTEYSFDIELVGENGNENFTNENLDEPFKIRDLVPGAYEITISIPAILHQQVFGITISESNTISGKITDVDTKSKSAKYSVSGSTEYNVHINGIQKTYLFDSANENEIVLHNLNRSNEVHISGKNECQGKIKDVFSLEEDIVIYPTITSGLLSMSGSSQDAQLNIYNSAGQLVLSKLSIELDNTFHLDSLPNGLYIIDVVSKGNKKTFKIIKQ